jgi:arginine-tRNA-protein transferase
VRRFELPSTNLIGAAWQDGPPGRLDDPDLYDGMAWRRAVGYLIDAVILFALIVGLWMLVILSFGLLWPIKLLVTPLLPVAYHTYFVGRSGATPGMQVMDVEIRSWTGRRPDYVQAFLMTALFYATVLPTGFLVLAVALFNDRQRTLHDYTRSLIMTFGMTNSGLDAARPVALAWPPMGPTKTYSARPEPQAAEAAPKQVLYVLMETPCPYLAGRRERKLMTEIHSPDAIGTYSRLSRAGFRRSHNFAYRPACGDCTACVPVRVRVDEFKPSPSLRRVRRLNAALTIEDRPPEATEEQFAVFTLYLESRHNDGEMAGMSFGDYRTMVCETRLDTRLTEFREPDGRLAAACLTDWLEDGPSAVYSFYAPDLARRSLGTFMVLWLIEAARRRGLPHVYLGYWIGNSGKMSYKARFQPIEGLGPDGWQPLAT